MYGDVGKMPNSFFEYILSGLARIRLNFLFHFRLKPRILQMKEHVAKIVHARPDKFPAGKSLFVFPGSEDILYFVIFRDADSVCISEVFDELFNPLPASYQLLKRINLSDVLEMR